MIGRLFAFLFIFVVVLFYSCDYNIKTWQDYDESSPVNEGSTSTDTGAPHIGPAIENIDGIFTESDDKTIFSLPSNIVLSSGTFLRNLDKNDNKFDLSMNISSSNAVDSFYGIALVDKDNQSNFNAVLFSQSGRIKIGKVTNQNWSEKIGIEKSVNLILGNEKENSIHLLFDEQTGNFSLFINSVHECDFYLDGIRTTEDIQYSLCVCVGNTRPVVEFKIKEDV